MKRFIEWFIGVIVLFIIAAIFCAATGIFLLGLSAVAVLVNVPIWRLLFALAAFSLTWTIIADITRHFKLWKMRRAWKRGRRDE